MNRGSIFLLGEEAMVREFTSIVEPAGFGILGGDKAASASGRAASGAVDAVLAVELTNIDPDTKRKNLAAAEAAIGPGVPIITSAVTHSVAEQSAWVANPRRLVGLGALPTLIARPLWELSAGPVTDRSAVSEVEKFAQAAGRKTSLGEDRTGMVMPRILACLINEACFALGEGIASPEDVDTAMKLGTNYPLGPAEWGTAIGFLQLEAVLEALARETGDGRFAPAPLLRRAARSGSLLNS